MIFAACPEIVRPDFGVAQICHTLACLLGKSKTGEPLRVRDFMADGRLEKLFETPQKRDQRILAQFAALERQPRAPQRRRK